MRAPLYAKILGWFLLNLLLLAIGAVIFLRTQFDFDLNGLLSGRAGSQVDAVSHLIEAEIGRNQPSSWDGVLLRYSEAYNVNFTVCRPDGVPIAGITNPLPPAVEERFSRTRQPPFPNGGEPPFPRGDRPDPADGRPVPAPPPPPPRFERAIVHTRDPSAYWAVAPITLPGRDGHPNPGVLVIRSDSLNAGGLFFDVRPWLAAGAILVAASALFWMPFVRRITHSLSRMTAATRGIADGNFDIKLNERTGDELGSLAGSINRMARRLDGFVSGQKRFLGDIAHELCAPLARIQIALGILEERAPAEQQAAIADVREEADQISSLVNELLAFSKASLGPQDIRRTAVDVCAVAERAIRREAAGSAKVSLDVPEGLLVLADASLLERALANLIRNALRYSNGSRIEIGGTRDDDGAVIVTVADSGPGIPDDAIAKIFDPFFRPDQSRSRETGGAGLGLAIVKNCAEMCGGSVSCRNRQPSGLEVSLRLEAAQ
ncbi:MAG: HAMP domain-containing sensor histidine kinase [Chthoniobacterales bacterium]